MPSEAAQRMPSHGGGSISMAQTSESDMIDIMGLRLHNLHRSTIAERVITAAGSKQKMLVVNANANLVVLSQTLGWMSALFSKADIAFCDGAGVQLAIRLLKGRAAHRTTPPEWIGAVLEALGPNASIFWLGGSKEAVVQAARNYEARYGVRTAGVQDGFFDMAKDSVENLALVARINSAAPSILLVNMGMPRQERWLWDNWDRLQTGVAITGGALVDHAAGHVHRPPRWVANLGIEWLVRLVREPKRLWRRYLLGLPVFGLFVLRYAVSGNNRKRVR
ncbi:MAG TPA: WecB/TagA/CpsF family glycosyltransferase [Acidocella sp.]|jgi:N-acetylglucosaminyldiphosphoundecaprenol N-acetyl-beta-D-mannosaminyltransferase|uniref:WecB/TagA/CpsF family glycosyltransferase n=1 Tax=Acidocella sp. TaxID=50710 RepID=UPI002CE404BC|nr:WecB/TagA/CpsF family glycosyltransferase [Acidocella sp.]HVE21416.1 WecB/TagA/CpsF family glycosyltransferase [Acidocella sp.]